MGARKYRLHFLGLPHVWSGPEHQCCAYTQKIWRGLKMFGQRGHTVLNYGNEGSTNPYGETIQILTEADRAKWFGAYDPQKLYHLEWDAAKDYWRAFNARCVAELVPRVQPGDLIMTLAGNCQVRPIGDCFPGSYHGTQRSVALIEWGIGYYGVLSRYRVFESHSHREWVMGKSGCTTEDNDTATIPNFFDPDDFGPVPPGDLAGNKEPYFLFVGRITPSKGWDIAVEVSRAVKTRLILAGHGDPGILEPHVKFIGAVTVAQRNRLMTNAIATFTPTKFREPFGGTAVETQLCGTPAIATDHGAFVETVEEPWRCASHKEFVEAARRAMTLAPEARGAIRQRAMGLYSLDVVAAKYERYFDRMHSRWGAGWYDMRDAADIEIPTPLDTPGVPAPGLSA
jgi:glycosyltransferase involved in cell wall biosynthesis